MKDFQFIIQNFLKDHEKHKKYLALLLVLSIVVSFAVPFSLIMPAISMTGELICGMEEHIHSDECYELFCGLEESDEHLHNADCYTLVCDIPEHIHSQECYSDYQEENNFDFENLSPDAINLNNVMATDEQGRTLVSNMNGGVDANDGYSKGQLSEVSLLIGDGVEWASACKNANDVIEAAKRKYFLGIASDFCVFIENDFKPKTADTEGRVAVGGNVNFAGQYNYQIGAGDYSTMTALKNTDNYINVDNFAHLIVGGSIKNLSTLSSTDKGSGWGNRSDSGSLVQTNNTVYYPISEDLYKRFVIGASTDINSCSHITWLESNGWRATETPYNNSCSHDSFNPNEIAQFYQDDLINFTDTFNWLRQQSEKLSKKTATGTTTFSDGVLTLNGSGVSSDTKTVYFTLDDKLPDGWNKNIGKIEFTNVPENSNLVVNYGGDNVKIDDDSNKIETWINDEQISNTGTNASNNNKKSEQILYNFYNATSVFIDANFNGTILAPNADVTSEEGCNGHLSGSLIAKTFTGGLEFGYRPYRGGMEDILGSTAGYTIPFNKFKADGTTSLAGASFTITDETENKVVDSWKSDGNTKFINIPTKVDFEGKTIYDSSNDNIISTYIVQEQSAPEGYVKSDKTYTITVDETVDINEGNLINIIQGEVVDGTIALIDNPQITLELAYTESPYSVTELELNIVRNGWGYTALHVECEGDFVFTEKDYL
ncbi:MAG: collagen-binding domain-containing protein, partial [Ruminococcus sp.]